MQHTPGFYMKIGGTLPKFSGYIYKRVFDIEGNIF